MAEQAPKIEPGRGRLVYDKVRKMIVAVREPHLVMTQGEYATMTEKL